MTGERSSADAYSIVRTAAEQHPEALAIVDGTIRLTYGELVGEAERVASGLRHLGVGEGTRVALLVGEGSRAVVCLLALARLGACAIPLGDRQPAERVRLVLENAGVALTIVDEHHELDHQGRQVSFERIHVDELTESRPRGSVASYVIYTSGSTGTPKGVVVPLSNVVALLDATQAEFDLDSQDVWTLFHSVSFDFSVWEIWGALGTGGTLVVVPHETRRSPADFAELLVRESVTVLSQTPSAFTALTEQLVNPVEPRSVRLVVLGGEPVNLAPVGDWLRGPRSAVVVNMYGITETTVHVTCKRLGIEDVSSGSRSVGLPLHGWGVRIVDAHLQELPAGEPGEILVTGAGLARGYLGRPNLTQERFVVTPGDGITAYRSGDRGRLLPNGEVEHLGRMDSQVKILGHRVELGEVETALNGLPYVSASAVFLEDAEAPGLVACLTPFSLDVSTVRRDLEKLLPGYMVPSFISTVRELPLTENGKVDFAVLRKQHHKSVMDAGATVAGRSRSEQDRTRFAAIWREYLGEGVHAEDDFFQIGGDSLTAMKIVAMARQEGIAMSARSIYVERTLTGLLSSI